jgi:UPF0755 protein
VKKLLLALVLVAVTAVAAVNELQRRWLAPLAIPPAGYSLTIAAGSHLGGITRTLAGDGVLADPWMLRLYGRWSGADQQIKRGEYLLPAGINAPQLLAQLQRGDVVQYQVTLPEGITLARAVEILAVAPALERVLQGPRDARLLAMIAPYQHAEGLFFPDTYRYQRGDSDLDILSRAHRAMAELLAQQWPRRAEALPYENPYEALIMASIIERETGMPSERAQIAGVFVRRLQRKMRLQTDPTVIYGLGEQFDGNLTRAHLRDGSNRYNSYRHHGLPPTPIALPGREAVVAALHPAAGETLYFVARGDGGHVFSKTLAEHEAAVRKYQLRRRADYRSTVGNN